MADADAAEQEIKQRMLREENTASDESGRLVYLAQSRKLERFRGKPTELTFEEWVEDAKAISAVTHLKASDKATFIIDHLTGRACREILCRGEELKEDPQQIFQVLLRVSSDGDSLLCLQQQFFTYKLSEGEDIVAFSLELVRIYDRIVQLDPSSKSSRETQLKSRLAEGVCDDNLRTELRRLNSEHPDLSYFEAQDHVMKLEGR